MRSRAAGAGAKAAGEGVANAAATDGVTNRNRRRFIVASQCSSHEFVRHELCSAAVNMPQLDKHAHHALTMRYVYPNCRFVAAGVSCRKRGHPGYCERVAFARRESLNGLGLGVFVADRS